MEYAAGFSLALAVAVFAARSGLDGDRAFYPTVLVVIASYYVLFGAVGGAVEALAAEAVILLAFAAVAVVGFRRNLWLVVIALIAHGALDLGHHRIVANPGVPDWWPMFCLAFDGMAAAAVAWRLRTGPHARRAGPEGFPARIRPRVMAELSAARIAERAGEWSAAFGHLERAHVLGQASTIEHVRVHLRMLGWALRHQDLREVLAQVVRIGGAATMTVFGLVPAGNTGGGNVSPFQTLAVPEDLAVTITQSRPPRLGRVAGMAIAAGLLLACGVGARAAIAAPPDLRMASVDGRGVAYRVLGAGQPVIVMISGLGGGMASFKTVAPELARAATVIVYDRAGYGQSPAGPGPADAKAAARDLDAVLRDSGVGGPYILAGHSLGGLYAEYYAATRPDRIAGLVLEESRAADFSRRCEAAGIAMCAPTPAMMAMSPRGAKDEAASLAATVAQVEAAGPAAGKPVLVLTRHFAPGTSPFEALWIRTQADLAARYPGATHLTAPGGGHDVHRDERDWFVQALRRFADAKPDAR